MTNTLRPVPLLPGVALVGGSGISHPLDGNALLFQGADPTLIDCGTGKGFPQLKQNLDQLDCKPEELSKVLGTHGHFDHVGGMKALAEHSGARLYLHEADHAAVESRDPHKTATFLYEGETFPKITVDGPLEDGATFTAGDARVRAIHTPGHTPGSVSFLAQVDDVKLLVLGDTVGAHFNFWGSDFHSWKRSLGKLVEVAEQEQVDFMITGHSGPKLLADPLTRLVEAEQRFCGYLDPFFDKPGATFQYGRP